MWTRICIYITCYVDTGTCIINTYTQVDSKIHSRRQRQPPAGLVHILARRTPRREGAARSRPAPRDHGARSRRAITARDHGAITARDYGARFQPVAAHPATPSPRFSRAMRAGREHHGPMLTRSRPDHDPITDRPRPNHDKSTARSRLDHAPITAHSSFQSSITGRDPARALDYARHRDFARSISRARFRALDVARGNHGAPRASPSAHTADGLRTPVPRRAPFPACPCSFPFPFLFPVCVFRAGGSKRGSGWTAPTRSTQAHREEEDLRE